MRAARSFFIFLILSIALVIGLSACKRGERSEPAAREDKPAPADPQIQAMRERSQTINREVFEIQRAINNAATELAAEDAEIKDLLERQRSAMIAPQKLVEQKIMALGEDAKQVIKREQELKEQIRETQRAMRTADKDAQEQLAKRHSELNEELGGVISQRRRYTAEVARDVELGAARRAAIKDAEDMNEQLRAKISAAKPEAAELYKKLDETKEEMHKLRQDAAHRMNLKETPEKPAILQGQ